MTARTDKDRERIALGWVDRIATNVLKDHYRRLFRRRREVHAADGVTEPPSDEAGPADVALEQEARRLQQDTWNGVVSVFRRLRDADREMLERRFLKGQSHEEMARELGVEVQASKKRLQRAVERLRTELRWTDEEGHHGD